MPGNDEGRPPPSEPAHIEALLPTKPPTSKESTATPAEQRDAAVTPVTPKTPAERSRAYRKRQRDAVTEALVTPASVTPVTPDITPHPVMPAVGLTKSERDDLIKITRERGRVSKARVEAVKAELAADVEKKLSEEFKARDEMWRDGIEIAEHAVKEANAQIQRVCEERGVPAEFRPSVDLAWSSRGRNVDPARRAELRKLAAARVDAIAKQAKLTIDAEIAETVTNLYVGGLTSEAAREHLAKMPDPRSLMPPLEVAELEAEYTGRRQLGSAS